MLETLNLSLKVDKETYKNKCVPLQRNLRYLQRKAGEANIPVIIVFEGWDGAGKGSNIEKIAEFLDPRHFAVHSTVAPSTEENLRHFLWRFWMRLPANGDFGIFDRSWYGRVLIERIENLITKKEKERAYREINEFEQQLADDGAFIIKFWLHISRKEQQKRFKKMSKDPLRSWMVTKEDWNNHKKYDKYLKAAEEMLSRTDKEYAPWETIESHNKRHALLKVLETLNRKLAERIGEPFNLEMLVNEHQERKRTQAEARAEPISQPVSD